MLHVYLHSIFIFDVRVDSRKAYFETTSELSIYQRDETAFQKSNLPGFIRIPTLSLADTISYSLLKQIKEFFKVF